VQWRAAALAALAATAVFAVGCSSAGTGASTAASSSGAGFWTRQRLLGAQPMRRWTLPALPSPGATPSAHQAQIVLRVGALFAQAANGDHFCTASVVASPGHDLLMTAAHCIHGGKGHGYNGNIVFVPDYRDGTEPFGVWTVKKLLVAPQWANSSDPDFDVGFVVLNSSDGKNIEDVLGANQIGFNAGFKNLVRVTGYPDSADAPVACLNYTTQQSASQLRFECGGFFGGTSGSPWVTRFDLRTRTGTIVGVIGGYQQGGDTDAISYSAYLGDDIKKLYEQAEAAG
jgi:V8-like Glu-specific endopeptidase